MKKRHFYQTGIDITNAKSMFNYINNHFTYFTMNSWNQLKSIANNVKLYNLDLDGDYCNAIDFIFDECDSGSLQSQINDMIYDWEREHPGYVLGFNGRSSGYLVIYNKDRDGHTNCRSIVPDCLLGYDTYKEWKASVKESWYDECIKDYIPILRETTKVIRDFDKLCDELRLLVNDYSKQSIKDYQLDE